MSSADDGESLDQQFAGEDDDDQDQPEDHTHFEEQKLKWLAEVFEVRLSVSLEGPLCIARILIAPNLRLMIGQQNLAQLYRPCRLDRRTVFAPGSLAEGFSPMSMR